MRPPLRTTLGVNGHRPVGGHLDGHAVLDVFGALTLVTGRLPTRLVERPRQPKPTRSAPRYLQEACARHLRDLARAYPAAQYPRGVGVSDKAPGHRGPVSTAVLAAHRHLEWYPFPGYRPQGQVSERCWKVLRRRATPNRRFPTLAALKQSLRNNLGYYQTLTHRGLALIQSSKKRTKLAAA